MVDSMALALEHKIKNPHDSYKKVTDLYGVSKSSLYDRHTSAHAYRTSSASRRLPVVQEEELVRKINEYAERGTILTSRRIHEFAEAICGGKLGVNWSSRFIQRYRDTIHPLFFSNKEVGHLQTDNPGTSKAVYHSVRDF